MILYHYTVGMRLQGILDDGVINTSPKLPPRGEKPIVWLSTNTNYEHSARKIAMSQGKEFLMTIDDMLTAGKGIFRFSFNLPESEVSDWQEIRKKSGMSSKLRHLLLDRAKLVGAKESEWYGIIGKPLSIEEATLEQCTAIKDGILTWNTIPDKNVIINSSGAIIGTFNDLNNKGYRIDPDKAWNNKQ